MDKTLNKKELEKEIKRRRTFAIISHPDAGKTTITEQLLLFGGAIRQAGTVKAKKTGKFATSDWMEIEKQRGISVTSSVMQFDYDGKRINILDTPGHEDFSEDTYRTLMAVDSAVMVIDSGNGIEEQTEKLFKVCRMRGIPIFTFINKLDRVGRDPFELVEELEEVLGIDAYPMNWPIGMGKELLGLYDIYNQRIEINRPEVNSVEGEEFIEFDENGDIPSDHPIAQTSIYQQARDEAQLLSVAGNQFDAERIQSGELTPVFFGSALTDFGVESFLHGFLDFAPEPANHLDREGREIEAVNEKFSGFIFKIQANMDPKHRDRIGFLRITSGEFDRGMDVSLARTGKDVRLNNTTQFLAEERETVSTAVAGDIIGLYDTGTFQIGDTIYEGKEKIEYPALPSFTPELFMNVRAKNAMKQKSFYKGLEQLVQEGAIQLYKRFHSEEFILGAVGQLQFEVFEHRLNNEYNSEIIMEPIGRKIARWIDPDQLDKKMNSSRHLLVRDRHDHPVLLFESEFALRFFQDKYPDVELQSLL